jgi:pyruvate kinase
MYDAISKNATTLESICSAAVQMASQTDADIIIAISRKGSTVKSLATFRPNVPIMAFVPTPSIGRRLILHRGVYPIVMSQTATDDEHERVVEAVRTAKEIGWLKPNHRVVVVDAELWGLESTKVKTKAPTASRYSQCEKGEGGGFNTEARAV